MSKRRFIELHKIQSIRMNLWDVYCHSESIYVSSQRPIAGILIEDNTLREKSLDTMSFTFMDYFERNYYDVKLIELDATIEYCNPTEYIIDKVMVNNAPELFSEYIKNEDLEHKPIIIIIGNAEALLHRGEFRSNSDRYKTVLDHIIDLTKNPNTYVIFIAKDECTLDKLNIIYKSKLGRYRRWQERDNIFLHTEARYRRLLTEGFINLNNYEDIHAVVDIDNVSHRTIHRLVTFERETRFRNMSQNTYRGIVEREVKARLYDKSEGCDFFQPVIVCIPQFSYGINEQLISLILKEGKSINMHIVISRFNEYAHLVAAHPESVVQEERHTNY